MKIIMIETTVIEDKDGHQFVYGGPGRKLDTDKGDISERRARELIKKAKAKQVKETTEQPTETHKKSG